MSTQAAYANLRVNAERLWNRLGEFARIGATAKGGVHRLALSNEDKIARDLLGKLGKESGYDVRIDAMGNMFLRRAGRNNALSPVLIGSHLDSQPLGGRYDGAYGVLAALEVLHTLDDHAVTTERPIELVNWTNEEGARFAPAMIGSGVYAGIYDLETGLACKDADGVTIGQALQQIGYDGTAPIGGTPVHAAFEIHIEQGQILETEGKPIGVVTGAQGQRWFEVTLVGRSAHAGTTPMSLRKDALIGLSEVALAVQSMALALGEYGRGTIGMVRLSPNSRNVVPGEAFFSVEFRHPEEAVLEQLEHDLNRHVADIAHRHGLTFTVKRIFRYSPIHFDASCINAVRDAATRLGYAHRDMLSGAGHDACYLSKVTNASMIFIPCVDGISHNEAENILPEWSEAGANVLLHATLCKADESQ